MGKRKLSQKEVKKKFKEKGLKLLSEYINNKRKVKVKCLKCGHIWYVIPNNVLNKNRGCPKCAGNLKLNHDEVKEKLFKHGFELLSKYNGFHNKITIKCLKCGKIIKTTYSSIYQTIKNGFKYCKTCRLKNDIEKIKNILKEKNLELLSEYNGSKRKIKVKCISCGFEYETTAEILLYSSKKCKKCSKKVPEIEEEFIKLLKKYSIKNIIHQYKFNGRKEIDIYLPDYNIGIELNGLFYHSYNPLIGNFGMLNNHKKAKWHLYEKKILGLKHNIDIIFIFEHEYYNKDIFNKILNFILLKIGLLQKYRIYARDCIFKEIDNTNAFEFYNNYHILGKPTYSKHFGLIYNDKLVSLLSIRKEKAEWIINRYCIHPKYKVIGGFQKLLKNSIKSLKINKEKISTFIDLRFVNPNNNVFIRNGFKVKYFVEPRYFYWKGNIKNKDKLIILERREAQKNKLKKLFGNIFDENLTEEQNMFINGFLKCYDAGKIKLTI